jgi:ParB-like chromosome segregation protein Spo0J
MIETIEQYLALKATLAPVAVSIGRGAEILIPCANTLVVRRELVLANTYNPNSVSDDKMELLRQSIVDNGFCFPIVTIYDPDLEKFVIIDGFHRYWISGPEWLDMAYVPVVVLDHDTSQRMAATWQFNKARGVHQVDLDADLIRALIEQGVDEDEISTRLGIDLDTVFRYKQVTGIAELFKNTSYSMSWEMVEVDSD